MLHLTKKDFKLQWFSGTGPGGQNRNKNQNCCRISYKDLTAVASGHKERTANQREAFETLAKRIVARVESEIFQRYETNKTTIRNYNESRNEVHDKASGLKMPYSIIINDIYPMVEARRDYMLKAEIS